MIRVAYLFERFPSFTQTFCYREVRELCRQGMDLTLFSIRRPTHEPSQNWNAELVRRVQYLPDESELLSQVRRALRENKLSAEVGRELKQWGRQTDFLRLYQAACVGMRMQEHGIRRLHAHFAGMAARTAYWIRIFFGIPYSFTAHANDIFAPRPFAIGLDRLIESASAVVTESDHAAEFLKQRYPKSEAKICRVYNGLELSDFAEADFASPKPCIISVGRLIEKKGFADLIEACRLLKQQGHSFRCEIIGEGPLHVALCEQIRRSGFEETECELLGPLTQKQIAQRFAAARVFVLPCMTETSGGMDNLPTVIMEAMAAGLPVVSTPVAGVPEMVEAGVTGELVPQNDPKAVSAAIEQFLTDSARAQHFGRNGRARAQEKFAVEKSARALILLFEKS
jgi:colanic acid/amylovoran biosynthesis glycosyltransferase